MYRTRFDVLCVVLLAILLSPGPSPAAADRDAAVAKVNGVAITKARVEGAIDEFFPAAFFHGSSTPEKREKYRPQALDLLIKRELYYQAAVKRGMSVGREAVVAAVKKVRDRFKSDKDFAGALKRSGYTAETFAKEAERKLMIEAFVEAEITAKARVTDEALKEYYEQNKKDFMRPEGFRLRHILIKVPPEATAEERAKKRKDAEEVLKAARRGDDFGDLAYKHSMDDWRIKGGDLGLVHKGRLDPALEEAAMKLEPGQISDLVETIYGFHILKLGEKVPPMQMGFEDMKAKLRKQLEESRKKEREETVLKGLKDEAKIEVY